MSDERIDLEALSAARNPARYEALVQRITAAAMAGAPKETVATSLVKWGRVAMAGAALASLAAWVPAWVREEPAAPSHLDATTYASWAHAGEVPSSVDVLDLSLEPTDVR